jgi:hypothetical protein
MRNGTALLAFVCSLAAAGAGFAASQSDRGHGSWGSHSANTPTWSRGDNKGQTRGPYSGPASPNSSSPNAGRPNWTHNEHWQPQGWTSPSHDFPTSQRDWRTDYHRFDRDHWRGGRWWHGEHWGHFGWWYVVEPDWYFYTTPIYPYPDIYTPPGEEPGWWYWCPMYQDYYPYVTFCPGGWVRVAPQD